jgi:NADPH:quinone reductase-like Zn-dependent oxidoreductase
MKAVVQEGYGPPKRVLRLAEVEPPPIGDDDALIRMRASSVNTPDWITVTGVPYVLRMTSGLRGPRKPIRGTDVAGVVENVGAKVKDLEPGDEVFGSVWSDSLAASGAFAELAAVPAARVIKKPSDLTFEEAAASVMSGITALAAVGEVADVQPGSRVLINGASGGVGTFAVHMAKARGAEVTGICSARNVELVESLGADHVVDYTKEDFTRAEARYDVVLDNVLNHPPRRTARVLVPGGILMPNSVGNTGGMFAGLPRMARAALMRFGSTKVKFVKCVVSRDNLHALAAHLESGEVKVIVDKVYPLAEVGPAVAHMYEHHARGKVVISISSARFRPEDATSRH